MYSNSGQINRTQAHTNTHAHRLVINESSSPPQGKWSRKGVQNDQSQAKNKSIECSETLPYLVEWEQHTLCVCVCASTEIAGESETSWMHLFFLFCSQTTSLLSVLSSIMHYFTCPPDGSRLLNFAKLALWLFCSTFVISAVPPPITAPASHQLHIRQPDRGRCLFHRVRLFVPPKSAYYFSSCC